MLVADTQNKKEMYQEIRSILHKKLDTTYFRVDADRGQSHIWFFNQNFSERLYGTFDTEELLKFLKEDKPNTSVSGYTFKKLGVQSEVILKQECLSKDLIQECFSW
jgi:hypothetical protein